MCDEPRFVGADNKGRGEPRAANVSGPTVDPGTHRLDDCRESDLGAGRIHVLGRMNLDRPRDRDSELRGEGKRLQLVDGDLERGLGSKRESNRALDLVAPAPKGLDASIRPGD